MPAHLCIVPNDFHELESKIDKISIVLFRNRIRQYFKRGNEKNMRKRLLSRKILQMLYNGSYSRICLYFRRYRAMSWKSLYNRTAPGHFQRYTRIKNLHMLLTRGKNNAHDFSYAHYFFFKGGKNNENLASKFRRKNSADKKIQRSVYGESCLCRRV